MYKKFALITLLSSVAIAMVANSLMPSTPDATGQTMNSAAPPPPAPSSASPKMAETENAVEAKPSPVFGAPSLDPKGFDPKPAIVFEERPKPPPPPLPPSSLPTGQNGKPMISPHDRPPPGTQSMQ